MVFSTRQIWKIDKLVLVQLNISTLTHTRYALFLQARTPANTLANFAPLHLGPLPAHASTTYYHCDSPCNVAPPRLPGYLPAPQERGHKSLEGGRLQPQLFSKAPIDMYWSLDEAP